MTEEQNNKCKFCGHTHGEDSNYCERCGGEVVKQDYEDLLGIKISEEDIKDYVLLGRVQKVVHIGKIKVGIRTLTSGEWKKVNAAAESAAAIAGQNLTFTIEQNQRICAYGLTTVGGNTKLGELSDEGKYDAVQEMASDFVEIVASKISLLHRLMMAKIQEGQLANF